MKNVLSAGTNYITRVNYLLRDQELCPIYYLRVFIYINSSRPTCLVNK